MFCEKCGTQNPDNTAYCSGCGAPLNNGQSENQQQTYQQPGQVFNQGYPQGYQQPMYQQPMMYQQNMYMNNNAGKGLGITSMVLGIISLLFTCFMYFSMPCAIVSIILGGAGLSQSKAQGQKNGFAVAGLVCSIIAVALFVIALLMIASGEGYIFEEFYEEIFDW